MKSQSVIHSRKKKNTIPNFDKSNNKFYFGNYVFELPEGTYEIVDIEKTLNQLMSEQEK